MESLVSREIHDATPDWAKLDWANGEIDRLHNEVSRRDAVLHWIAKNMPGTLELCPYKLADNPAKRPS